jgi:4-hydroxybenzoate polyprenyltransferase
MSGRASAMDRPEGSAGLEPQTHRGGSLAARYASLVKLPHTLFALPFAGLGAVLASYTHPQGITPAAGFWIVVAFTAARFAAMGFNRIVDRRLDALNPRTAARELPTGRLTLLQATAAVAAASALFIFSAWQLNPLCGWLSPVALGWVFFYSYTKRFTAASHLVLGLALGIAPVGAYLAVTGEWTAPWYALVLLAGAVSFWVAGFDTVYALQDVDFDRRQGLHSIPARLGAWRGLLLARLFHALALAAFLAVWFLEPFPVGALYLVGLGAMAALLGYEHWLVRDQAGGPLDLGRIDRAFFHTNVGVSMSLFLFTLLDRVLLG